MEPETLTPGLASGKVVLVTGGASGIGRAAAEMFAAEGAEGIVVVDRDIDGAQATAAAIGSHAMALEVDVTDEAGVASMVADTISRFGRLDVGFNNAGINDQMHTFHELAVEDWDRMLATNLTSVFLCMKHELVHMVGRRSGAIVNTSSGAGLVAAPGLPHYTAAKHGVLGLTRAAAQEYARQGIRVNAVLPGATETAMLLDFIGDSDDVRRIIDGSVITGRMLDPHQIAEAVVWLGSDVASRVNGQSLVVDGGGICH